MPVTGKAAYMRDLIESCATPPREECLLLSCFAQMRKERSREVQ